MKTYIKHHSTNPHQSARAIHAVPAGRQDSPLQMIWLNIVRRKIMLISLIVLAIGPLSSISTFKYQSKTEAAWYDDSYAYRQRVDITNAGTAQTDFQEDKTLGRMAKGFFSGASLNKSWQSHKKKQYDKQRAGNIEKKKANVCLIKSHIFLADRIANIQKVKLNINPNNTTGKEGLSREGIKIEITKEPKNNVPTLMKISANLSSWPNERRGNFTVFNITKDYIRIINSFQELA